jgi:hypothetical protein
MARERKIHLKLNGKAMCGVKRRKSTLRFATAEEPANCGNCKRVAAT